MRIFGLVGTCLALTAGAANAQQITAVAVSPDGATLLVAGANRVIYTVDPATLAVTDRRYEPGRVKWMEFSGDGSSIYVLTDDARFAAYAVGSFKQGFTAEGVDAVSYSRTANRLALLENKYDGGILRILQATNGKEMAKIIFPEIDTELVALSDDGKTALILTDGDQTDAEPKANPPSDVKDHDKYLFRQQNDGYMSQVLTVNLQSGEFSAAPTYYRVSFPEQVRMQGDAMAIINDRGDSALVQADGNATLLNLGKDFVSMAWLADDGASMMLNSGDDVAIVPLTEGAVGAPTREFEVGRVQGPTERVSAVDQAGDGTLYMGTTAYRLWKLTPDGAEIEVAPVF
jgi:hypothetical protein